MPDSTSQVGSPEGPSPSDASSQAADSETVQAEIVEKKSSPPFDGRRIVAVLLMVVLCDLVIYRGHGYAGLALFLAAAPLLLCLGRFRPARKLDLLIVGGMLFLLAGRLLWHGSIPQVVLGCALLLAFAMTLSGLRPFFLDLFAFTAQTLAAGGASVTEQIFAAREIELKRARFSVLAVIIPLAAILLFGLLFTKANPDIWNVVSANVTWFFSSLGELLWTYGPWPTEILFWMAVMWITAGVLRPLMRSTLWAEAPRKRTASARQATGRPAALTSAFRNMLFALIGLFAIYLAFEFYTLWFRDFPTGFHYSGYAHEGALWLTMALVLATGLLSVVFRGAVLRDPREPMLRRLAWAWSLENFLLAAAVYHRLMIYVGFNGMTRMRMIGFFGISLVVVGFILVLRKIATGRDFIWLARRQTWALAATVYLYCVTPVDLIVTRYNVERIMAGDSAPSVQISEHPNSSEGIMQLTPLLDCEDPLVRKGVSALLSMRYDEAQAQARRVEREGWTAFQWSDWLLLKKLREEQTLLGEYQDDQERNQVWQAFKSYAYQWY